MLEILECGLYHEQKRHICMSEGGSNVLKTRRYNSALSSLFSFILLKPLLNRLEEIAAGAVVAVVITVLPAYSDSDIKFCSQSYQGLRIAGSLVY